MHNLFRTVCLAVVWGALLIQPQPVSPADHRPGAVVAIALRNWPPHYLTDPKTGAPTGFAIDVLNRVARSCDLDVRYVVYDDWPDAFVALESRAAIVAPNLGITDARRGLYDFTVPYETFRISIFVRTATSDIHDAGDLVGRMVGVIKDNQGLFLMRARGGSDLCVYNSLEEAFMALLSGRVDALVGPGNPILGVAMRSGLDEKLKIIGKPLQEIKRAIAVRKENPELFQRLDGAIRQFIATPEYKRIYEKWHGKAKPFWNVSRVVMGMGILLGLSIAGMFAWRHRSMIKMNRSLVEAEQRLREIVQNTSAGYFFIDAQGRFRDVNDAWLRLHGYGRREEVIGQPFTLTQEESCLETAAQNVQGLLAGNPIPTGEATRRCRDGSIGHHTFSAHPVVQQGKVIGLEGFIIDCTEAHQAAEAKRQMEERFWLVNKAKSLRRMAGAIAHHFNNQLAVVQGNLELAVEDLPDHAAMRSLLGEAAQAARRASEISGLLLIYLGQSTVKGGPIDLSAVCRQEVPLLRDSLPEGITLETDLMDVGPVVHGAGHQIHQVLTRLIANAAEAIGDRGGTITLATKHLVTAAMAKVPIAPVDWQPEADAYACLEVADSGCGMTQEDLDRLFDPFFSTKFMGRGLGLPVVLGILKACRGAIGVESTKDQGSIFRVFLPVVGGRGSPGDRNRRRDASPRRRHDHTDRRRPDVSAPDDRGHARPPRPCGP